VGENIPPKKETLISPLKKTSTLFLHSTQDTANLVASCGKLCVFLRIELYEAFTSTTDESRSAEGHCI